MDKERIVARRRRPDDAPIETPPPPPPSFSPGEWAEDALGLLDYVKNEPSEPEPLRRRRRARRYLNALQHILGEHPSFAQHEVRADLALLSLALDALDSGVEHEILRRRKAWQQAPETNLTRQFRLFVLQCCDRLVGAGLSTSAASSWLAEALTAEGIRSLKGGRSKPATPFSGATVKRWYQATRSHPGKGKDAERPDEAEWLFRRAIGREPESVADAKKGVVAWLKIPAVRAYFPECAKPAL
jgi:hypothetical protein